MTLLRAAAVGQVINTKKKLSRLRPVSSISSEFRVQQTARTSLVIADIVASADFLRHRRVFDRLYHLQVVFSTIQVRR